MASTYFSLVTAFEKSVEIVTIYIFLYYENISPPPLPCQKPRGRGLKPDYSKSPQGQIILSPPKFDISKSPEGRSILSLLRIGLF